MIFVYVKNIMKVKNLYMIFFYWFGRVYEYWGFIEFFDIVIFLKKMLIGGFYYRLEIWV